MASITAHDLAMLLRDGWRRPGEHSQALGEALRGLVVDGRVAARTRIPSERELSKTLGVSRGSVSRAYAQIREDGYLMSERGAGSWLTLPAGPTMMRALPVPDMEVGAGPVDLTIAALPAPDGPLTAAVARAAQALPRHLAGHGYATAGLGELRAAIAARLSARGLATSAEEVLVTAGAQHALHLVLGLLVVPGDRVLVDAPAYPRALA
ncbi:MAG: transcriptional regulator, GntR family with aminotransferase domain, partial [Conexibacter sp.]|nr:transcriptional regulator, GntR family with aminotransferase domain [Conexibacter sp.]